MGDGRSQQGKQDRSKVSGYEQDEIPYVKDKMGVTSQAVTGAIRATDTIGRMTLEDYLKKTP